MVDGVGEAVVAALSSDDDAALFRTFLVTGATSRDRARRRSRVAAGHPKASASSVARTVLPTPGKDARIAASVLLFLRPKPRRLGRHEAGRSGRRSGPRRPDLTAEQADARDEQSDMGARGF